MDVKLNKEIFYIIYYIWGFIYKVKALKNVRMRIRCAHSYFKYSNI